MVFPSFRHHHHHRFLQRPTRHQQEFKYIVKGTRIRAFWLRHWKQFLQVIAEQITLRHAFARAHPVFIATHGVDFTIMTHEPIGLRSVPGRKSVSTETRMHHSQMRGIIGIAQIRKVKHDLFRGQLTFIDDHFGRQTAYIEHAMLCQGLISAKLLTGLFTH